MELNSQIINVEPNLNLGAISHKVSMKKYFEVLNYVNGIRGLKRNGEDTWPYFKGITGAIYFLKIPNCEKGNIAYDQNIRFSENEELNERLVQELKKRLEN